MSLNRQGAGTFKLNQILCKITYFITQLWECFADKWKGVIIDNMPVKNIELAVGQSILTRKKRRLLRKLQIHNVFLAYFMKTCTVTDSGIRVERLSQTAFPPGTASYFIGGGGTVTKAWPKLSKGMARHPCVLGV